MSLEEALKHIKEAEREIAQLVEKEKPSGQNILYTFAYEQTFSDQPGWGPNYQVIQARDIKEAFSIFGNVITRMDLVNIRNICYGKYEEMQEEMDSVSEYYRQRREQGESAKSEAIDKEKVKDLLEDALLCEGSHHKQWYLWKLVEVLGISMEDIDDDDIDRGIRP